MFDYCKFFLSIKSFYEFIAGLNSPANPADC